MKILNTLAVADAVLAVIQNLVPEDSILPVILEPYMNGRERGYVLRTFHVNITVVDVMVAFSEFRRSDSIVVYVGNPSDFSPQGNVPSDVLYNNATFFKYDDLYGAARFIIDKLKLS